MDAAKNMLRRTIKAVSLSLSDEYIRTSSEAICARVLSGREYMGAETIFCYVSAEREPDTTEIITDALASGRTVLVPRCIGGGVMETVRIRSLSDLTVGFCGIREPPAHIMPTRIQPELSIIPCVCCDRMGNRLGHGGGYYDRFLKNAEGTAAALCFERLIVNAVPIEPHDIKPYKVITEKNIY